jgi:Zn-dependent protease with chaperone function
LSPDLGVIPAAVLVFAVTALTAALAGVAAWPALARVLRGLPPATQAGLLLGFAAAPALAGLTLLVLALSPSLAHLMGLAADHCHGHAHHAHFCPTHSPLWTGGAADWLILAAAGAAITPFSARLLARLVRVRRVVRTLEAAEVPAAGPRPYRVVDADAPVALTAGLIRPRIYLSSHLLSALAPAELTAVVGHEQAH